MAPTKQDDTHPINDESEVPSGGDAGSRPETARVMGRDPRPGANDRAEEDEERDQPTGADRPDDEEGGKGEAPGKPKGGSSTVKETPGPVKESPVKGGDAGKSNGGGRDGESMRGPRETDRGAAPVKSENSVDATRGEPLATRAIHRRDELEEILHDTKDPATRYDIELALSSISQLLTGDIEHLSGPTALAINRWLEGSKHLGEMAPRRPAGRN